MSGGLNQDDSKLVFESSEKVQVISTFDQLNLKEDLLRGIYAYSKWAVRFLSGKVPPLRAWACIRLRKTVCYSAASYSAHYKGARCDRTSTIRDW